MTDEGGQHGALQRRTVRTLVASQAVGALGITIGIATASLLARDLSGSDTLAGLTQTGQVLGAAGASWLLARLMAVRGRRVGLVTGYLIGASGAALAVVAGIVGSMLLLVVGAVLLGATTSANYAARYAATDLATPATRGRALSIVVWATTIGAVAGPNLTGAAADLADALGIPELTGPFVLGAASMLVAGLVVAVRMRPDPLLVAREAHAAAHAAAATEPLPSRPVGVVLRERPMIAAAIVALAAAHAVMVSVMVMTPLHMEHGGAALRVIGIVISLHVLGMFAFAPVVGFAADRLGRPAVMGAGGIVLLVSLVLCAISPAGSSVQIFSGLFLLGLGWSMATVASSTLVAEQAPIESLTTVQGTSDLAMNLAAAFGGALSGVIVGTLGFAALSLFASVFAAVVLLAAGYAAQLTRSADVTA
ncbi:MFS transporter [Marmoricola sp. RAF53]|uniref:MFS transporter n=1 Tax=Marmoricola sp. RAF53 TaxID=3233059 RepID=UPI003F99DE3D